MLTLADFRVRQVEAMLILQRRLPRTTAGRRRRWADARPCDVSVMLEGWCQSKSLVLRVTRRNRLTVCHTRGPIVSDVWTPDDLATADFIHLPSLQGGEPSDLRARRAQGQAVGEGVS